MKQHNARTEHHHLSCSEWSLVSFAASLHSNDSIHHSTHRQKGKIKGKLMSRMPFCFQKTCTSVTQFASIWSCMEIYCDSNAALFPGISDTYISPPMSILTRNLLPLLRYCCRKINASPFSNTFILCSCVKFSGTCLVFNFRNRCFMSVLCNMNLNITSAHGVPKPAASASGGHHR